MAKVYHNKREHLVIQMTAREATELNFGIPVVNLSIPVVNLNNVCLCGTCNCECKPKDIYYVCGINEVLCKDCVEDYVANMNHYIDDDSLTYELRHFNHVAEKLDMHERAALTPNGKIMIYDKTKVENPQFSYT